jgi:hypothetical protein
MFEHVPWDIVAAIAGVIAIAVARPPAWTAIIDLVVGSRKARQEVLDALPDPEPRELQIAGHDCYEEEAQYIMRNGLDVSSLNARLAAPAKAIHKALRTLVDEHKVEVFPFKGVLNDDPRFPNGTKAVLPIFFRGGLNPSMRPTDQEASEIIQAVRPGRKRN